MLPFSSFAPPSHKLFLRNKLFYLEIWPETGGAVACFDYLSPQGVRVSLFRPTSVRESYQATDLACWPLVPYSNRIAEGRFIFQGKSYRLPLNIPGHPHSLHGIGWQTSWQTILAQPEKCHIVLDHKKDDRWPFDFTAEQFFTLNEHGLTIVMKLTNRDAQHMPYGLGQHPYISRPQGTKLFAQVEGVWQTDDTVMPTIRTELPATWDLRNGCALDGVFMDNCFDCLKGAVRVVWPNRSELTIEGSDNLKFLVVYNPPQEGYVCVEPVSHMTDAVNRAEQGQKDTGFAVLKPGEQVIATYKFSYRPASPR